MRGSDFFADCREAVSALAAAERYGVEVNRSGFACCPFHGEKTPSLKFYPDGHFHCFGCGAHGSSIDFVSLLFGIPPLEAAKRLNADFDLGLEAGAPPGRAEVQRRKELAAAWEDFEAWRWETIRILGAVCLEAHRGLQMADEMGLFAVSPSQAAALRYQDTAEELQDVLLSGSMEKQMMIFRDRKAVNERCARILDSMPMKSLTA